MFFIFKIIPDWFWLLLLGSAIIAVFFGSLPQLKTYALVIKSLAYTTIATTIFILGMLYCDNAWKSAAQELQAKVTTLEQQSQVVNTEIKERVVTKVQVVKTRGQDIVQYIDREVTKSDGTCVIPTEFVQAHNRAAEAPK